MIEKVTEKSLTPQQRKAIEALLTNGSVTSAAQAAGVAKNTMYRWMRDEAFIAALHEAEAEAVQALSRSLVILSKAATAALATALGPGEKTTTRLRAAEIVIGNLLRLRELVDLEARISTLEANQK